MYKHILNIVTKWLPSLYSMTYRQRDCHLQQNILGYFVKNEVKWSKLRDFVLHKKFKVCKVYRENTAKELNKVYLMFQANSDECAIVIMDEILYSFLFYVLLAKLTVIFCIVLYENVTWTSVRSLTKLPFPISWSFCTRFCLIFAVSNFRKFFTQHSINVFLLNFFGPWVPFRDLCSFT